MDEANGRAAGAMRNGMNPSLAALTLGVLAIVGGHLLGGGELGALLSGTALLIVLGGSLSALLLQTPRTVLRRGLAQARCLADEADTDPEAAIRMLLDHSRLSRSSGFLALEPAARAETEPFLRRALEMLVDGVGPEELRRTLAVDVETFEADEREACRIWESLGAYAPTIGIVGAVLGLIQVTQNLAQPGALGSGIAVAMIPPLYGLGLAHLFCLPLANRIRARIREEVRVRRMLLEGFGGVAEGIHPKVVERRMRGHLAAAEAV